MDEPADALQAPSHPDPYPWYERLREERPIFFDATLRLWVVSGALVGDALRHPALRVRPPAQPVPAALLGRPTGEVFARLVRMNDGDFHARHRPEVASDAARWGDAAVAAAARAAALDLVGRADANALLSALPVQAMARLLGVPGPALDATVAAVLAFVQGIAAGADADALARSDAAAVMLMGQGEAAGLDPVRAANRIAMMQQALDATAGLIGNAVLHLRSHPGDDLVAAVAEAARRDPPVHNTRRFAAGPLVLGGMAIADGDGLLLLLAAAHRERFLGFGAGPHACPGERIAIGIAASGLQALRERRDLPAIFGGHTGYRPLPNARIPVFSPTDKELPW